MPIDFYYMAGSPPCYAVLLLGKTMGLNFNMKYIDYENGDHKTPEYEKLNPQKTVPLIKDDGFLLSESRAILCYLVEKYAKDDSLYPKDLKKRTVINHRLYFDIGTLYQSFLDYYCAVFETGKYGEPSKLEKLKCSFKVLDNYLDGSAWVSGNEISVADYTIAATVASCEMCPQQTVPLINDDGFLISESRPILCYLVEKYAKDDSLYPKDIKKRTIINHRLYFDIGTLYQGFLDYYCAVLETGKFGQPSKLENIKNAFKALDTYIDGNEYVAGNYLSVADYAIAGTVATMQICGFDVSKYSNVSKWFTKMKKTLPGYEETVGSGTVELRKFLGL